MLAEVQDTEILPSGVGNFLVLHFLPVFDFIFHFYQLFLVYVCLCTFRMSIKKVVPYFCVLREGYYVIIYNYGLHEKLISIIIKLRKDYFAEVQSASRTACGGHVYYELSRNEQFL